jgi:NAD(P)-dependent dehydrogenase (short-subunit alcohol dehydrogenase family)
MEKEKKSKCVLITGIGRGIGKALTLRFLSAGYRVMGTTTDGLSDITHPDLTVYKLLLEQPADIDSLATHIKENGTRFDILVNNAGAIFDEDETAVKIDKLRQTLEVNLVGTINLTENLIPFMDTGSHIVNISSTAGSLGEMDDIAHSHSPYHYPAYKISKCALNMYTRTLAARLDHEGRDIVVSSMHPGWVKTNMGGDNATLTPDEAANSIFEMSVKRPETGQFWFGDKKLPW